MNSKEVIENIKKRRENIINGKVNCIPSPFINKSKRGFIGIEQKRYYLLTAGTKVGKTQLASFVFLYTSLEFAYNNPSQCDLTIHYINLEEDEQQIYLRYMSYLLFKFHDAIVNPTELNSTVEAVNERYLSYLEDDNIKNRLDFFDSHVIFKPELRTSLSISNYLENYAKTHLKTKNAKYYRDETDYDIVIVDHIGKLSYKESLRKAIDFLSTSFVNLRNTYKYTIVCIQQQDASQEGWDAKKLKSAEPGKATLSENKNVPNDCDMMIGLFSPDRLQLETYKGYNISVLGNFFRTFSVNINRNGSTSEDMPLYFIGDSCCFIQLPSPKDKRMVDIYRKAEINQHPIFKL